MLRRRSLFYPLGLAQTSVVKPGFGLTDAANIFKFLDYGVYLIEVILPINDPNFKMVLDETEDKWKKYCQSIFLSFSKVIMNYVHNYFSNGELT